MEDLREGVAKKEIGRFDKWYEGFIKEYEKDYSDNPIARLTYAPFTIKEMIEIRRLMGIAFKAGQDSRGG